MCFGVRSKDVRSGQLGAMAERETGYNLAAGSQNGRTENPAISPVVLAAKANLPGAESEKIDPSRNVTDSMETTYQCQKADESINAQGYYAH